MLFLKLWSVCISFLKWFHKLTPLIVTCILCLAFVLIFVFVNMHIIFSSFWLTLSLSNFWILSDRMLFFTLYINWTWPVVCNWRVGNWLSLSLFIGPQTPIISGSALGVHPLSVLVRYPFSILTFKTNVSVYFCLFMTPYGKMLT